MGEHSCCYPKPPSSLCQSLNPHSAPCRGENSPHLERQEDAHSRGSVAGLSLTVVPQEDKVAGLSLHDNQGAERGEAL